MPPTDTIPSPADTIKSLMADNTGGLAGVAPAEPAPETQVESDDTTQCSPTEISEIQETVKKGLAESLVSDTDPEPKKEEKTEVATEEKPRDGEKPAQFIARLKKEKADAANQAEQLRKEIAELKSKKVDASPELNDLRRQLAERDSILEETAYERTAKFQTQFAKPIQKLSDDTKKLVGKFSETPGVFERASNISDEKERLEYLRDSVGDAANIVFDKLSKLDELKSERDAVLKDRAEISKTLAEQREQQSGAEVMRDFDSAFDSIKKNLSIYRGEQADSLRETAKSLISGEAAKEDVVAAAYMAAAFPSTLQEVVKLRQQVANLEARIKTKAADAVSVNGRGGDNTSVANSNFNADGSPKSISQVITGR